MVSQINKKKIKNRLQLSREAAHIKQSDVAKELDVSVDTIWRWENNKSTPSIDQASIIAKLYKTTVAYLVGETDIPEVTAEIPTRVGSPLQSTRLPLPVNEPTPARDSDVFATLGTLINQLEKTYPNMTEEDQKLARGLLNRCLRTVCSDLEAGEKREVI